MPAKIIRSTLHRNLSVQPCNIPLHSMLCTYKKGAGFTDCYVVEVSGAVTQEAFIKAFYTSPLFKIERTLLQYFAAKPATDLDANQLARGKAEKFSAWNVESQSSSELLLADFTGRTRSWLMALPVAAQNQPLVTRLYFGSAVVPLKNQAGKSGMLGMTSQKPRMGWVFYALRGFHRLYSRWLLRAAGSRVGLV